MNVERGSFAHLPPPVTLVSSACVFLTAERFGSNKQCAVNCETSVHWPAMLLAMLLGFFSFFKELSIILRVWSGGGASQDALLLITALKHARTYQYLTWLENC